MDVKRERFTAVPGGSWAPRGMKNNIPRKCERHPVPSLGGERNINTESRLTRPAADRRACGTVEQPLQSSFKLVHSPCLPRKYNKITYSRVGETSSFCTRRRHSPRCQRCLPTPRRSPPFPTPARTRRQPPVPSPSSPLHSVPRPEQPQRGGLCARSGARRGAGHEADEEEGRGGKKKKL